MKARMKDSGKIVAIKRIQFDDDESLKTILGEIKVMEECKHHNIVHYYCTYSTHGNILLV